jgi:hypothetical protein
MQKLFDVPHSYAACLNREGGAVSRSGAVSHLIEPAMIDPLHIMLGVGCDDWGTCLFLTITDAAKLSADLCRLLADHAAKG